MKENEGLLNKLICAADLAGEAVPGLPLLELHGTGRALVENHAGVTQYTAEKICIKVSYGTICINGSGLELACMTKNRLVIKGQIQAAELLSGRK